MKKHAFVLAFSAALLASCGGGGGIGPGPGVIPPPVATSPTVTTQAVFTNLSFSQPVALKQAPGDSSRWFVLEKNGVVRVFANDQNTTSPTVFLDISAQVNPAGEGGLLGIAFHSNFPVTPEVFVSYTRTGVGTPLTSVVSRFLSTDTGQTLNAATEEIILTISQPFDNHNGGDISFGPDGFLYLGVGDGGDSGDPEDNGQDTNNLLGTIVRVDVTGGSPYAIPAGNPFEANAVCTGGSGVAPCPEIYAWGLRNPWRMSFDAVTSRLWTGDVGQDAWEEIDVVLAGENYGWNVREGDNCFNPPSGCADTFAAPIAEYDHSQGQSVTGGYVYRGTAIPDLVGWYVFGDFVSGRLFGIPQDSADGVVVDVFDDTGLQIVSFAEDTNGEIFLLNFGAGTIFQVVDAP